MKLDLTAAIRRAGGRLRESDLLGARAIIRKALSGGLDVGEPAPPRDAAPDVQEPTPPRDAAPDVQEPAPPREAPTSSPAPEPAIAPEPPRELAPDREARRPEPAAPAEAKTPEPASSTAEPARSATEPAGQAPSAAEPAGQAPSAAEPAGQASAAAEPAGPAPSATEPAGPTPAPRPEVPGLPGLRYHQPLGMTLRLLEEGRAAFGLSAPALRRAVRAPDPPPGGRFETRAFTCPAGSRDYKLYVPSTEADGLRGLLVMLHGCRQGPDDFAVGTGMNDWAERERLLVAYPAQSAAANALACWNWFNPDDQRRDSGEPAIIAGITRSLLEEFAVAEHRCMVAGLSAGGSMAAVLGATYPDLFDAVGIHSGVAYGAASDAASAFAAMRGDRIAELAARPFSCRTIVFHGDADRTVHPDNAVRLLAAAGGGEMRRSTGTSPRGRPYRVEALADPRGVPRFELWTVEGAGHAWSGGSPEGSYSDPDGPDASAEMIRFFLRPA